MREVQLEQSFLPVLLQMKIRGPAKLKMKLNFIFNYKGEMVRPGGGFRQASGSERRRRTPVRE
jgi:hypothetical protein